jgi:hypothetical protein
MVLCRPLAVRKGMRVVDFGWDGGLSGDLRDPCVGSIAWDE